MDESEDTPLNHSKDLPYTVTTSGGDKLYLGSDFYEEGNDTYQQVINQIRAQFLLLNPPNELRGGIQLTVTNPNFPGTPKVIITNGKYSEYLVRSGDKIIVDNEPDDTIGNAFKKKTFLYYNQKNDASRSYVPNKGGRKSRRKRRIKNKSRIRR